jgi:hypothetical protein
MLDCRPHKFVDPRTEKKNELQKKLNTFRETIDGSFLGLHHLLQVEFNIANLDTALFRVVQNLVVKVGVVQQRFRGNTSDVQAGATKSAALLNASSLFCLFPISKDQKHQDFVTKIITFKPSCPALMAATYPATPPPIMTRSCSSDCDA